MYTLVLLPELHVVTHPFLFPPTLPQDAECLRGAVLSGCVAGLRGEEWKCLP